jgi:hypothetical protein
MARRTLIPLLLVCVSLTLAGCGRHATASDTIPSLPTSTAPIPGAPGVPLWLRVKIWQIATGLGDPHPEKIAVTLNLHQRGRVVDRVWMRGHFVPGCKRAQLAGYTFNVKTHITHSSSWSSHCGNPH